MTWFDIFKSCSQKNGNLTEITCGAADMTPKSALKSEHRNYVDIDYSIFLSSQEHRNN